MSQELGLLVPSQDSTHKTVFLVFLFLMLNEFSISLTQSYSHSGSSSLPFSHTTDDPSMCPP